LKHSKQITLYYELSNFGKENFFSKNNSAYWLGKKYIGIGPSAHSYDGFLVLGILLIIRCTKALDADELPNEIEILSEADRFNEYIMTDYARFGAFL
jgi:oxygen-independent coproporphyrinogen-3 oxidase